MIHPQQPRIRSEGPPRPEDPRPASESPSSFGLTWLLVLAAGLLGGLAGFAIGESGPKFIRPSTEMPAEIRRNRQAMTKEMDRRKIDCRRPGRGAGVRWVGNGLGCGTGRCGRPGSSSAGRCDRGRGDWLGPGRRRGRRDDRCVAAVVPHRPHRAYGRESQRRPGIGLRTHGGIWLTIGAAAGLALGIGLGNWARIARALIGGVLGAVVGSVIYEFGGAVLFPLAETFRPMSHETMPRLFADISVALCIAAGALLFANHLTVRRTKPQPNR